MHVARVHGGCFSKRQGERWMNAVERLGELESPKLVSVFFLDRQMNNLCSERSRRRRRVLAGRLWRHTGLATEMENLCGFACVPQHHTTAFRILSKTDWLSLYTSWWWEWRWKVVQPTWRWLISKVFREQITITQPHGTGILIQKFGRKWTWWKMWSSCVRSQNMRNGWKYKNINYDCSTAKHELVLMVVYLLNFKVQILLIYAKLLFDNTS